MPAAAARDERSRPERPGARARRDRAHHRGAAERTALSLDCGAMSKAELDVRLPAFDDALEALPSPGAEVASGEIGGYKRLQPGDRVLYSDLDYPMMRRAMEWLRERRGVLPVRLTIPEPATHDSVLDTYAQMLQRHPRTRLVLLTHLSHCTGLVMPVREIAALARDAGAEVIVDAAHSWGRSTSM